MGYEPGGRADKFGNRYEYNWAILKLLDVVGEKLSYVILEALGDDEEGVDIWVADKDGNLEGQQCKGRYGSNQSWDYGTVNAKGIWSIWKKHLERNNNINVSLVSPLSFVNFEDIIICAQNNNGNAKDFIKFQIDEASQDIRRLFKNICARMEIELESEEGKETALSFFKRMHYRQYADSEAKEIVMATIERYFCGDAEKVYEIFLDYIINGNIYGKKITLSLLNNYLEQKGVMYRNLARDRRIWPGICKINDEYKRSYLMFSKGMVHRNMSDTAWLQIQQGKSVVLHGNAGVGKSGCSVEIINFCENNNIPYIAVKLDKHLPNKNSEMWSNELGLPASITYCLDTISKENSAVVILDQLDALRWTQAHSRDSLSVCRQIINEIKMLNRERTNKISIVFICRTYDLNNDTGIKMLFDFQDEEDICWKKIEVNYLDDETIIKVVGEEYNHYPSKIKKLLKTASNLYIWEKLDKSKNYSDIEATYQLVAEWWKQISNKAKINDLNTQYLTEYKDKFVEYCDRKGCIAILSTAIGMPDDYKSFLISSGFMISSGDTLSFTHQSILDCFLSEHMVKKYFAGKSINEIIGSKEKQTPGRRYQVQIFLQQILEFSVEEFIDVGSKLLESPEVRCNVKYVFIELLPQIKQQNDYVWQCEEKLLKCPEWKNAVISSVVMRNVDIVHKIRESGLLECWITEDCDLVIDIMRSIAPNYDNADIEFIRKHALGNGGSSNWWTCFHRNINEGSDEYFDLRLDFYRTFPETADRYLNFKEVFSKCAIRAIGMLKVFLELNARQQEKSISRSAEDFVCEETDIIVNDYKTILEYLLPVLPPVEVEKRNRNWVNKYLHSLTLERTTVLIIKMANRKFAECEPEKFWESFQFCMNKGNHLYNELLLDAFLHLPDEYADKIMEYLYSNLEKNAIENTSGNENELQLAMQLIEKYSGKCDVKTYEILENKIMHFSYSKAPQILAYRIEKNKERKKNGYCIYWSYWGDLQSILLPVLDEKRRSKKADELIEILLRRDNGCGNIFYYQSRPQVYTGDSTISEKTLTLNNWKKIITDSRTKKKFLRKSVYKKNVCIEKLASEFEKYISHESIENIINGFVNTDITLECKYIDALFSGVARNDHLDDIPNREIEKMILKYGYDLYSDRAGYICMIIGKKQDTEWGEKIYSILTEIALYHENSSIRGRNQADKRETEEKVRDLEIDALNCTRGKAIRAISALLWEQKDNVFVFFKDVLEQLSNDENLSVRYALLWALWPAYNCDSRWAIKIIMRLFSQDYRLLGFRDSRWMLCEYYSEYIEIIDQMVLAGLNSNDERLERECGFAVAELHMIFDVYTNILDIYNSSEKNAKKSMLEMIILYVEVPQYREKAIALLSQLIDLENDIDNQFLWEKLFREDMLTDQDDKNFIRKIITSKINICILDEFYEYVCRKSCIKEYADIIIEMCRDIIEKECKGNKMVWGWDTISKLIIGLYDEVSSNNTSRKREIVNQCLDIWDLMYEKNLGIAREFSQQIMNI